MTNKYFTSAPLSEFLATQELLTNDLDKLNDDVKDLFKGLLDKRIAVRDFEASSDGYISFVSLSNRRVMDFLQMFRAGIDIKTETTYTVPLSLEFNNHTDSNRPSPLESTGHKCWMATIKWEGLKDEDVMKVLNFVVDNIDRNEIN